MKDEKKVVSEPRDQGSQLPKGEPFKGFAFKFAYIDPASMTHIYFFAEDRKIAYNAAGEPLGIDVKTLKQENIVPLKA